MATNPLLIPTLNQAITDVVNLLNEFADDSLFSEKVRLVFGVDVSSQVFKALIADLPEIEVVGDEVLQGALGAFSTQMGKIYLSQGLVSGDTNKLEAILIEEIGHYVDAQVNAADSPGDEGQIFAALVQGIPLPESELQALKQENDFTTILVNGQAVQIEQARIQESGGQQTTPFVYTLPLEPQLTLVKFSWENYSVPDEFQITYEGIRIAGNVGLQSGGGSGERIVATKNSNELTVKVTAPTEGTAWNFDVETLPLEININGLLGDVVEVDLLKEFTNRGISLQAARLNPNGFGLKSNSNNRGKVAEIDNWQTELQKGKFYFVPTVNGTPRQLNQPRSDAGLGESTLTITNGNIEFPIKFNVTDSFSTAGDNRVTVGTQNQKLDIYRQQQRLSYLGFPGNNGNPLTVDGVTGNNSRSRWEIQLFNIATSQRPLGLPYAKGGRGRVTNYPSTLKESEINSSSVPKWTNLNGIQNFTFVDTQRRFGTNSSASAIQGATNTLGSNVNSTGVTGSNGEGDPSKTHDGGRGVDIDTRPREAYNPGANFFLETRIKALRFVLCNGRGL